MAAVRALRERRYDAALDFQGLWKSAAWARLAGARRVVGFDRPWRREPGSALLIGELSAFGIWVFPEITLVLTFLIMAVVLVVRPWGLLGKPQTATTTAQGSEPVLRPAGLGAPGLLPVWRFSFPTRGEALR